MAENQRLHPAPDRSPHRSDAVGIEPEHPAFEGVEDRRDGAGPASRQQGVVTRTCRLDRDLDTGRAGADDQDVAGQLRRVPILACMQLAD